MEIFLQLFVLCIGFVIINNGNWTEWSAIWYEIIRVISKWNERAARVPFEITSMISDQNCTTWSSIATLLDPFWNRTFAKQWFLSFIFLQSDWLV